MTYVLFDKIVEAKAANSILLSAKNLLNFLKIETESLNFKVDLGSEYMSNSLEKFYSLNAYNLSLAAKEGYKILTIEYSSFYSLTSTIKALKNDDVLFNKIKKYLEDKYKLNLNIDVEIIKFEDILKQKNLDLQIKKSLDTLNIAYYVNANNNQSFLDVLNLSKANIITLNEKISNNGYELYSVNKDLSYKLASNIILDAFDNAADCLVVDDARSFFMFDKEQKMLEESSGRDINLPILSIWQVVLISLEVLDKSKLAFSSHNIKQKFIK